MHDSGRLLPDYQHYPLRMMIRVMPGLLLV